MNPNNPAAHPCTNIDKGPVHQWVRHADGTAQCINCGIHLDAANTLDAFGQPSQVNKTAGGARDVGKNKKLAR